MPEEPVVEGPRQLAEGVDIRPATEDEIEELLPLMRAYCDFYEVSPTDEGVTTMARTLITEPRRGRSSSRGRTAGRSASPRWTGSGRC
jgi:hypothetical protein